MHPCVSQGEGCGGQLLPPLEPAPRNVPGEQPLRGAVPAAAAAAPPRPQLAGVFSLLIFSCSFK